MGSALPAVEVVHYMRYMFRHLCYAMLSAHTTLCHLLQRTEGAAHVFAPGRTVVRRGSEASRRTMQALLSSHLQQHLYCLTCTAVSVLPHLYRCTCTAAHVPQALAVLRGELAEVAAGSTAANHHGGPGVAGTTTLAMHLITQRL